MGNLPEKTAAPQDFSVCEYDFHKRMLSRLANGVLGVRL